MSTDESAGSDEATIYDEGPVNEFMDNPTPHREHIFAEIRAMAHFARNSNPENLPGVLAPLGEEGGWNKLSEATLNQVHQDLTAMVWPATPVGIMQVEAGLSWWRYMGPVPLIRWLIFASIVSLIATAVSFVAEPNFLRQGGGFGGANINIIFAVLFVISAAGLGASFYTLYTAFRYVNNRSYDPVRNSTYIARFVLGLVAGLILTLVLFGTEADLGVGTVGLAIIGGFSSDIVFRILTRLAETIEFAILGERGQDRSGAGRRSR